MKWRSKVTGAELAWVRDSWEKDRYVVTCSFLEEKGPVKSDSWDWLRLPYSDFVEAFERVEE